MVRKFTPNLVSRKGQEVIKKGKQSLAQVPHSNGGNGSASGGRVTKSKAEPKKRMRKVLIQVHLNRRLKE